MHVYTCIYIYTPIPTVVHVHVYVYMHAHTHTYNVHAEDQEGGSDHVILPDPVLLPVESLSSYSGGITC